MRCYKCGSVLSANDICPKCQTDVSIYKKTAMASDVYYNKALEKARLRDLSGAIETLKVSLMINKYNINARNLLGLIYCEMGEVVEALSQWVMSKNLLTVISKRYSRTRTSLKLLPMLLRSITYL